MNMQGINTVRKIVIYSHDTMGLGHVRRNLLIATTLAKSHLKVNVLLISGAHQLNEFDLPSGVDCLTLPSIEKLSCGAYASRQYNLSLQSVIQLRSKIIKAAVLAFEPDMFIVDNVPRGVESELDPVLQFISVKPDIICILGIRDILDAPEVIRQEWQKKQNEDIINKFYDVVWVYGDRNFYDSSREYGFSEKLNSKLSFTGYLDPLCRHRVSIKSEKDQRKATKRKLPESFHLCMAGGGQDGINLIQAFADAIITSDHYGVILTGPYVSDKALKKLRKKTKDFENIRIIKFHHEPVNLIILADKVVSMGGYNSLSEILALQKTALIVPRVTPREEQRIRAKKLHEWGLITSIQPDNLNADVIKHWLETDHEKQKNGQSLDFNGLNKIVNNIDWYYQNKAKTYHSLNSTNFLIDMTAEAIPLTT